MCILQLIRNISYYIYLSEIDQMAEEDRNLGSNW